MVQIGTMPLLGHIVSTYNSAGVKDIVVVRGYKKEAIKLPMLLMPTTITMSIPASYAHCSRACPPVVLRNTV